MPPAKPATTQAPNTPPAMPSRIHLSRPCTPRVAASTMPMISPASMTSRKTMTSAPSMEPLLYDDNALGGFRVELAFELVFSGLQRTELNGGLGLARDHLFDFQHFALELLGSRVVVDHGKRNPLVGRDLELRRLEFMIF